MRILNVIQCANLGGMEQSNLLRLRGLKSRGHIIRQVSLNPIGGLKPLLQSAGIPAVGLDYRKTSNFTSILQMRRAFLSQPFDSIIMTGHNWHAMAALLGVKAHRRVLCIHYHHFERGEAARHWPLFYRLATNQFDAITFCSRFIREEALRLFPGLQRKSLVVFNPFRIPGEPSIERKRRSRKALGLPLDIPIVGNAGNLIRRKRFDIFIDTAEKICRSRPHTLFVIAGDGPEREALQARVDALGLHRQFCFLGWQANMAPILDSLDVLLFNSDQDALGRTPVEAATHGTPVVASVLTGGLCELLGESSGATVLENHDTDALAHAVLQLLADPEHAAAIGRRCRNHVCGLCSISHHTAQMEALLGAHP